jgi:hypothetical protein
MAANTSFKQQCPSCEENVLIKDAKLVGKKVDCPKCKFRFVVEEPKEEPADYEEVAEEQEKPAAKKAPAKAAAKTGAKPGSKSEVKVDPKKESSKNITTKKDANGKPAPAVKKKAKKDDDDGDDDDKPSFKKKSAKGNQKKVLMAAGIAVVAVGLLGVAGYFVFGGDGKTKTNRKFGGSSAVKDKGGDIGEEDKKPDEPVVVKAAKAELAEPSNHLVAGGDLVVNVRLKEVAHCPIGRILFDPANGLSSDDLKKQLGFGMDDVDRLLLTYSTKGNWFFVVIRTGSAMKLDALKASMKLKSAAPIKGQEYFLTPESWREKLPGAPPAADKNPGARPLAFRLHDPFTLVLADMEPMKDFLEADGKPAIQQGGIFGGAPAPPPPPPGPGTTPAAPAAKPYSTVNPRLKGILDRVEDHPALLMSVAMTSEGATGSVKNLASALLTAGVEVSGMSLNADNGFGGTAVFEAKSAENAKKVEAVMQGLMAVTKTAFEAEGFNVEVKANDPNRPAGPGPVVPVNPPAGAEADKKIEDPQALNVTLDGPKLNDRVVQASMKLSPAAFLTLNLKYLVPPIQQWKGDAELAQKQPTPHDLATAAKAMAAQNKGYPRGAFERQLTPQRGGRPYLPDERVSWMAELLPHLGYTEVHRTIDFQSSWTDEKNLVPAMALIPYFIDPAYPRYSRHVIHPKKEVPLPATHFVGIAGIGLEAASYRPGDPAGDGKVGVFGYDRTTPLAEVGNHTIIMVQVPPPPVGQVGPWIAGGGSTIRGVPEKNSVAPFISTTYNGKPGTYALMSDGSVRFISATVSDDVFKALAVIKKDKDVPLDTVPKVEKKTELKATDVPKLTP